jgi:hypothetical protein
MNNSSSTHYTILKNTMMAEVHGQKQYNYQLKKNKRNKTRVRHAFMRTGGNALHSPFVALNGHGVTLRKHEDSFGYDKTGKWKHESAIDRVAYLKVTKRPPTYFSNIGGLSLFYLDGRDEDGNLIKDISKQQTHIHGNKFTNKIMKQRIQ